ncbi:MAG: NDP-sugar synthase [Deltaproteobacteria bacterium]|nr:NDP-sugar synthase [Deltaproteobacteria bacterium]
MESKYKGLVLAAGFGSRLKPLTDYYPKPLVPFAGNTPLSLAISKFENFGIKDIAINCHYRSDQIQQAVNSIQRSNSSLKLKLSHEPDILGTGGALNPLKTWLGDASLVIINGDVVSTLRLEDLVHAHKDHAACATMALLSSVIPGESAVYHRDGKIKAITKKEPLAGAVPGNFACAQVVSRQFLELLPADGTFDIISEGYLPALAANLPIASFIHKGYWHDLGTPKSYFGALLNLFDLASSTASENFATSKMVLDHPRQTLIHQEARIDSLAKIGPKTILEKGATVAKNAVVMESVILPGAQVGAGENIHRMIIGAEFRLNISFD